MREVTACLALILVIGLSACFGSKLTVDNYHLEFALPNGIAINEGLYCDETEISNMNWREYMYWVKRVHGPDSEVYLATLPDTTVWSVVDSCLVIYDDVYLRHPVYDYYPVVGITQQQAQAYTKWRSDRVFEVLLLQLGLIEYRTDQGPGDYFSIDRYFSGKLQWATVDDKLRYYPEFRLPTPEEWERILLYSDSLSKTSAKDCELEDCKACQEGTWAWSGVQPCRGDSLAISPTIPVGVGCPGIYNLRGNVGEWSFVPGVAVGGGWKDDKDAVLQQDTFRLAGRNAWTGFRNVCEWKKREE